MHERTKALSISQKVKAAVYERDGGCCIWCGSPEGQPNAHFIPRSQSGLGIEENILTLCWDCHQRFDNSTDRKKMRAYFRAYLLGKYPEWDEGQLVYKKYKEY